MRNLFTVGVSALLLSAPYAYAQTAATLGDIVVVGAPDLLADFLKVSLTVQIGTPLSQVNPIAVQQEALATGFFSSVAAELTTQGNRPILRLTVVPNPTVADVTVTGATFVEPAQIKQFLEDRLNIASGTVLNNARVEESKTLLQQAYRENGFPFSPGVSAQVTSGQNGATVAYTIDESAPVSRVEVTGSTQLSAEFIRNTFRPLVDNKSFTLPLYQGAVQAIGNAYNERGLGGFIDPQASELSGGVLRVVIRERRVGQIDTSALGTLNAPLQSRSGELLNTNTLAQDIRTLANASGKAVGVNQQIDPSDPARVNLAFVTSDQATGPINEVRIAGASAVSPGDIAKVLKVRLGDVYTPQLAQEDYLAIQRLYRSRGFEVLTQAPGRTPIRYENGVLIYDVVEPRLAGYQIRFEGAQVTQERVILRELPEPGGVLNINALRQAVQNNVGRLGFVVPVAEQFVPDPNNPQNVTYVLTVREQRTGVFTPGIAYDTINGFSGEVGLSGNNLFGLGHAYSFNLTAAPSEIGEYLSGSASYTIPWLDFNFLDFRRNRTSLTFGLYSNANSNNALLDTSAGNVNTGRQYTERASGFSVAANRRITSNITAGTSVSTQYSYFRLEPVPAAGSEPGGPASDAAAAAALPPSSLTTLLSSNVNFDNVRYQDFPTSGVRASGSAGYGFGYQGGTGLSWTQYEVGARTYLGFGQTLGDGNRQQALAFRVNAGTIVGTAPQSRFFGVGGSEQSERFTLRGYDAQSMAGKNFVTSSVEYRYNFNVNTSIAQGIFGVAFVDVGDAWTSGQDFNLNVGYGVGVQLNLGLGNFLLPSLRFDYAFSPVNPGGKFYFRLGNFF
ncbi:BamA/OMP85 family outer membrane protein [Deinococcus peraridilitoris]|uniref:Outer membrane protein/protective antigen OMA87 n=1 Tax=Deinococcus peraridilitoris (strain DSM 19664 / LMG 22246 / CIP 109416 / KR-200) TaxID=937777 RepID=K9ZXT7_DEIPD|nr:POTRA domain-containing protein [Deinococcus peraridilitoris]AFZ65722.1 outer membrane protein/protective antigen OMA87 [Deinococcus peraridilitoris DSM 19664]